MQTTPPLSPPPACASGHAVAVSGVTASIGLFALAAVPVSFVRGVGLSGLFIPAIAALVSLTLLPAILRAVGPRLDWPNARRSRSAPSRVRRLGTLGSASSYADVGQPSYSGSLSSAALPEQLHRSTLPCPTSTPCPQAAQPQPGWLNCAAMASPRAL